MDGQVHGILAKHTSLRRQQGQPLKTAEKLELRDNLKLVLMRSDSQLNFIFNIHFFIQTRLQKFLTFLTVAKHERQTVFTV